MKRSHRNCARKNRTSAANRLANSRRLAFEQLADRRMLAVVFADFDGDGYQDMAVGVPGENVGTIADAGAVNVIYGSASGLSATGDQLWHQDVDGVEGVAETGDRFGASVTAGDFNNDGFDDLAIGSPGEAVGDLKEAGAVNILYGSAGGLTAVGDRIFHQDANGIQETAEAFDRFGAVLTSGDYDGDGYDDLAIGVPNENVGGQQDAGIVQILYGGAGGLNTGSDQILRQGAGGIQGVAERYDHFGAALATGDFNNDGRDDLAVGAPGEDTTLSDVGAVNVIYGTSSGLSGDNDQLYTQNSSGVPSTEEAWDNFGSALAAGDFDGDGRDDLAIGSPNEDHSNSLKDAGVIHVMYGRNAYGFDSARHQMWHQDSEWIEGVAEAYDYYGSSLAAGDFNGDGRDDLAIGSPGENVGSLESAGAVNIMYGRAEGLNYWNDRIIHQDQSGVAGVAAAYDYFGTAVAAGDTNGDGYADLGVAIPWGNDSGTANAGAVQVFRGKSTYGLRTDNDILWHQQVSGIVGAAELNDFFGGEKPQSLDGGVPSLQSNPGASKHLYLDFTGGWSNSIYTTYFKLDNQNTSNWTERSMIEDIWAVVAEDFAPFNINVTTFLPSVGEVFRVLIGGDGSERQANPTSGWKGGGDYTDGNDDNNDVYVYSKRIESWYNVGDDLALRIGTTASHEAGHGFGLGHKSTFNNSGVELDEYSDGGSDWTPIMGGNLSTDRTIWTETTVTLTNTTYAQGSNDFSVLQSELGLRNDDHNSSMGSATNLGSIGSSGMLMDTGIIRSKTDVDTFKFTVTTSGKYVISLNVADVGANLNSTLRLRDSGGSTLATHSPAGDLNATITRTLSPGTYYINVGGQQQFTGDAGQYTLRVQPGLVIAIPGVFEFAGATWDTSTVSINSRGGDAPANSIAHAPRQNAPMLVAQGAASLGKAPRTSQPAHTAAVDALMAAWSHTGLKHLPTFAGNDWLDALSFGEGPLA